MARPKTRKIRWLFICALLAVGAAAGGQWLKRHPQHNPYAAFSLQHPIGWATQGKIAGYASDADACFDLLKAENIAHRRLPTIGSGSCLADQRSILGSTSGLVPIRPDGVAPSCAVNIGLILWQRRVVQPAAFKHLGQRVISIEHMGSYNCRTIAGSSTPSEHATGNAIDISAFVLADGSRVTLLNHWDARDGRSAFLQDIRDGACPLFKTVLSPDYNAAHANHFHFDQAERAGGWSVCD
jgi:hypothetical protein